MSVPPDAPIIHGALPPGTRLNNNYEIDAFLKAGGMGDVYRGHEIETGDAVAIKLIRDELARDEAVLAMFRNEAKALRRIQHAAVVRYFGFTQDPHLRRHYLAMEFVEGAPLSEVMKSGPMPAPHVLALMRRVALGLRAAHEQQVVHRDMSPDNIIVPRSGIESARIIDFGIARSLRSGDGTVIGSGFAGKYKFVSPEQLGLFGGDVQAGSDIYSLGLVLAACLTGSPLPMDGTQVEIIERRRSVPDLSHLDPMLQPIIFRMLQPNPAARPQSMAEIAEWTPDGTVVAHPRSRGAPGLTPPLASGSAPFPPASSARSAPDAPRPVTSADTTGAGERGKRWVASVAVAVVAGSIALGAVVYGARLDLFPPNPSPGPEVRGVPPSDPFEPYRKFVIDYDGGDCFLAVVGEISATQVKLAGFADNQNSFSAFDAAFKDNTGLLTSTELSIVTSEQCPALVFAKKFPAGRDALRIADAERADSGEPLIGRIESAAEHVAFLIIYDDGRVSNASERFDEPSRRAFNVELSNARSGPVLLLAIASSQPIPVASASQPRAARDYFAKLAKQFEGMSPPPEVAMKLVSSSISRR
jgi:serine/threonine-protein kinase